MPNTLISPNMNMPVPVVGVDPGPDWANNVNACLGIIDEHNHTPGKGVQITPAGININTDLPMNGNNLTLTRSVRFSPQTVPLSGGADVGCVYVSGVDLWYNDVGGDQVRITQGGGVAGSPGSITGLVPPASASYAGSTFTWQSAANTPASMRVGPLIMGAPIPSPKFVTLSASVSQAADYSLTWPIVAPVANQVLISDNSGNLSWGLVGSLPIGSVIATFPNIPGAYTTGAVFAADASGFVLCQGQTIADASSPMLGQILPDLTGSIFLMGTLTAASFPAAGSAGGNNSLVIAHTHAFTSTTSVATSAHTHNMSHYHQWAYFQGLGTQGISNNTGSISQNTWTAIGGNISVFLTSLATQTGPSFDAAEIFTNSQMFTSGSIGQPGGSLASAATGTASAATTVSGTTNSAGSGTDSRPKFMSAVYLMRIK